MQVPCPWLAGHSAWRVPHTELIITFGGVCEQQQHQHQQRQQHDEQHDDEQEPADATDVCNDLHIFDTSNGLLRCDDGPPPSVSGSPPRARELEIAASIFYHHYH